ncbi:MAG: hypothetical protein ACHQIM_17700 [Sphingobacteriales bacterium]
MMEEDKTEDSNPQPEGKQQEKNVKPSVNMNIVVYNLLGLAFYTILFKLFANQGGLFFDAFVLAGHVLVCVILAISEKSWLWVLSGVLVLVIGFSTCTMLIGFN